MPVPYCMPTATAALSDWVAWAASEDADAVLSPLELSELSELPDAEGEAEGEAEALLPPAPADGVVELAPAVAFRVPHCTLWQAVWPDRSLGWAAVQSSRQRVQM